MDVCPADRNDRRGLRAMVSIFTGLGSGFERGSGATLGGAGLLGSGTIGRSGEQVSLNAATGNLLISQRDEFLVGRGPDASIARTYNSLGDASDENSDNWRQSTDRRIYGLTGMANTSGSTVKRVAADGSEVTYGWNGTAYVATDGAGAYDRLSYDGSSWSWTDGDSQVSERYANVYNGQWRITSVIDTSGNALTFTYNGAQLDKVTTANGEYVQYSWSGSNITQIVTGFTDLSTNTAKTLTRTRYGYDGANRLTSVTTDLSPEDNAIGDGKTYVTTYTYDGTSKRVASISQTDGSRLDISYDQSGRATWLTQTTLGAPRVTVIAYNPGYTTVTDSFNQVTRFDYNADGSLAKVTAPPAYAGAAPQTSQFGYDGSGNVTSVTDALGAVTLYDYDGSGNLHTTTDPLGNVVTRTYGSKNELLTETRTGSDEAGAASSHTTRYAYDIYNRLRYAVAADGSVTEYRYNLFGQQTSALSFTSDRYDVSSLGASTVLAESSLATWVAAITDRFAVERSETGYDLRGDVETTTQLANAEIGSYATPTGYPRDPAQGFGPISARVNTSVVQLSDGMYRITKTGGDESWWPGDADATSQAGTNGDFVVHLRPVQGNKQVMGGVSYGPTANAAFDTLNFAISFTVDGQVKYVEPGLTGLLGSGAYSAGDDFWLVRTGGTISYYRGATLATAIGAGALHSSSIGDAKYYFDSSLVSAGGVLDAAIAWGDGSTATFASPTWASAPSTPITARVDTAVTQTSDGLTRIQKTSASTGYDADATSAVGASGDFLLQLRPAQADKFITAGISTNPTSNADSSNIEFGFQFFSWGLQTVVQGTTQTAGIAYAAGETFWLARAGTTLSFYKGATFSAAMAAGPIKTLQGVSGTYYFDSSLSGGAIDVAFAPLSSATTTAPPASSDASRTTYVYDQSGQLLSRTTAGLKTEHFVYDGLGRMIASTDLNGATTNILFEDAASRTVVTTGSGYVQTSTYSVSGELLSTTDSGGYVNGGTAYNAYDREGQLRITQDATGNQRYFVYDAVGRKVADVDAYGALTEYRYDADDRLIATIRYQTAIRPDQISRLQNVADNVDLASIRPGSNAKDLWSWTFYDQAGRQVAAVEGDGSVTTYRYDASSRLVATTAAVDKLDAAQLTHLKTIPQPTLNKIPNTQFTNATGWGNIDNPYAIVTGGSPYRGEHAGRAFLAANFNATAPGQHVGIGTDVPISVEPGERLAIQAGVSASGGVQAVSLFAWFGGSGETVASLSGQAAFGTKLSGFVTVPPGATTMLLILYVSTSSAGAGSFSIDSPMVSTATPTQTTFPAFTPSPAANALRDSISRSFYDKNGRLIGVLDGEGYLARTVYDAAGRAVAQTAFATATATNLRASGSFAQLLDSVGTSAADRTTRSVYDGQGLLRFSIDAQGNVSEFVYKGAADASANGVVRQTIRYAAPIGTLARYTVATLQAALASQAGAEANRTGFSVYDAANRLAYAIDASGAVTGFGYDADGRLIKTVQYAKLRPTTSLPDVATMLFWSGTSGTTDDRITRSYYAADGTLRYSVDAEGYVCRFDYDPAGRSAATVRWDSAISIDDTTTIDEVKSRAVGAFVATARVYDNAGRLVSEVDANNVATRYSWNVNGTQNSIHQAYGTPDTVQTLFTYDNAGRVKIRSEAYGTPDQADTMFDYDGLGNVVSTTDANGNTTKFDYDRDGRKLASTDALDGVTRYEYDAFGSVVKTIDPQGNASYAYYDALGRVKATRDAESYVTETTYKTFGEVETVTRRANRATNAASAASVPTYIPDSAKDATTRFDYDKLGRVLSTTDALNFVESYKLNAFGQRVKVTGKLNGETINDYDRRGLLTFEKLPISSLNQSGVSQPVINRFEYDARGNRTKMTEADGLPEQRITSYVYDKLDRLVRTRLPQIGNATNTALLTPVETIAYDARGNVIETRTGFVENADGSVASVDASAARTLFWYDKLDRRIATLGATGTYSTTTYTLGSGTGGTQTSRTYATQIGLPATGSAIPGAPGGEYRESVSSFDKLGRLSSTSTANVLTGKWTGSSYVLSTDPISSRWEYDANGNVVRAIDANDGSTYSYYDKLGRKTAQIDQLGYLTAWTLDAEGNTLMERRYAKAVNGASATNLPSGRVSARDRVTIFSYDTMGNRLAETRTGVDYATINPVTGEVATGAAGTAGWTIGYNPSGIVDSGSPYTGVQDGKGYISLDITSSGADQVTSIATNDPWLPVTAGNRYAVQGGLGSQGTVGSLSFVIQWRDANGNTLPSSWVASLSGPQSFGTNVSGFVVAPPGAVLARFEVYATSSGAGTGSVTLTEPMFSLATAGQTSIPAFNSTQNLVPNSQLLSNATILYTYNAIGEVLTKTEATGDTTTYTYDTAGRLIREVRPAYVGYVASGNVVSPTVEYDYDGLGQLTVSRQIGDAWNDRYTRYTYGAGGRLLSVNNGTQHSYYYDVAGRKIGDAYIRVTSSGTSLSEGLSFGYDAVGNLVRQSYATVSGGTFADAGPDSGGVTTLVYNAYGEMVSRSLNNKTQEANIYDNAGRLWRSTAGDGVYRYYVYDANGNRSLTLEDNGQNNNALINRDIDYVLAIATNNNANAIGAVYTADVNVTIASYDARNQAVSSNQAKRQLSATGTPVDLISQRSYNAFGETLSETDALGNVTTYSYNAIGRATSVVRAAVAIGNADGSVTTGTPTDFLFYDVSGRLIGQQDANGRRTTRTLLAGTGYGGSDPLVVKEFHPDGGVISNAYDVFGDLRDATDAVLRHTLNTYDALGRLIEVRHAGGLIDYYTYDVLGQRIRHSNNFVLPDTYAPDSGETTDYDIQGRVVSTRAFGGDVTTTSYVWNCSLVTTGLGAFGGYVQTTTYQNGRTSRESSDAFGHVISHTDMGDNGGRTNLTRYDSAGRIVARSLDSSAYTYFNTGLVAQVTIGALGTAAGQTPFNYTSAYYSYDKLGQKTGELTLRNVGEWIITREREDGLTYSHRSFQVSTDTLQNATANYDALGRMTNWTDTGGSVTLNGTDAVRGRVLTTPGASKTWLYDAVGNVRRVTASFTNIDSTGAVGAAGFQEYWYAYDAMNRVTTSKGALSGNQIVRGSSGVALSYDAAGQRKTATGATQEERYSYDNAGGITLLQTVSVNMAGQAIGPVAVKTAFQHDLLGRLTIQIDYTADGSAYSGGNYNYFYNVPTSAIAAYRAIKYNAQGQVTNTLDITRQDNDTVQVDTTNQYGTGADYALGAVIQSVANTFKNNVFQSTGTTVTSYGWYDGAVQTQVAYTSQGTTQYSYYTNNAIGQLVTASVQDGRPRQVSVTLDALGQALRRDEGIDTGNPYGTGNGTGTGQPAANPHEMWYRFNGRQIGYVGNNGTGNTDYASSIAVRTATPPTGTPGAFRSGAAGGTPYADFDQNYDAINTFDQGAGGGIYTVRQGDTLAGIAAQVWGDASLWYKLAQANGLSGDTQLTVGITLTIPAGVSKTGNNAGTFRPYDPSDAYGDTSPTTPKPQAAAKGNKCGVIGAILLVVIAIAVTAILKVPITNLLAYGTTTPLAAGTASAGVLTAAGVTSAAGAATAAAGSVAGIAGGAIAGAIGSAVSQGFGIATRLQDKFSWSGVALSGIGAAVGGALGGAFKGGILGSPFLGSVARGALSSAVTQG
ncbi:hypothetical protein DBR17_01085, partial [Sphingomonas sp. HMWF008]